jgi:hypothetical protein
MRLRDLYIDLVGCFDCSIENNVIISTGTAYKSDPPHDISDMFLFNVLNPKTGMISDTIAVAFIQVGDIVEFRYKKEVFEVVSVKFERIALKRGEEDYFINRLDKIPF